MFVTLSWTFCKVLYQKAGVPIKPLYAADYLVGRSELSPRLFCSSIVVLGICDFHILVESQDFSCL